MGREERMKKQHQGQHQAASESVDAEVVESRSVAKLQPEPDVDYGAMEALVARGDLSQLDAEGRAKYILVLCKNLGLNPLMKPFDFMTLNGKLVCYTNRNATDQLRQVHKVNITIVERGMLELVPGQPSNVYVVKAHAALPNGRTDEATGAVSVKGLDGEALANAVMRSETKAKRRVTLSILGLSFIDESELDTVKYEKPQAGPAPRQFAPPQQQPQAAWQQPAPAASVYSEPAGAEGTSHPEAVAASGPAAGVLTPPLPPPVPYAGRSPYPPVPAGVGGGPLPPPRPATQAPLVTSTYPAQQPTVAAPQAPARPVPRKI